MLYSTYLQLDTLSPNASHGSEKRCDENSPQSTPQRVAKEVIDKFNETSAIIKQLREQIEKNK